MILMLVIAIFMALLMVMIMVNLAAILLAGDSYDQLGLCSFVVKVFGKFGIG